jgi:very-short-patch-repair endonuclease
VHQRKTLGPDDVGGYHNIPVTSPIRTLVDLGNRLSACQLEAAINEADKRDLVDPETLRAALEDRVGERGAGKLRAILDRRTFTLTDSELERRFVLIARRAGLPPPLTQQWVNGYRVDLFWPELGLVVETDGLRYHRTPAQQARDRLRDQAHTAAGLTPLRFTRGQVRFEPGYVQDTLDRVARRLASSSRPSASAGASDP